MWGLSELVLHVEWVGEGAAVAWQLVRAQVVGGGGGAVISTGGGSTWAQGQEIDYTQGS